MKILIGCDDFKNRTGMPMYVLALTRELKRRGHEVEIVSFYTGLAEPDEIKQHIYWDFDPMSFAPDILILNEPKSERLLNFYPMVPAYNIIHSPRPLDEPIRNRPQIRKYITPKIEDREYAISRGIEDKFLMDIPLPIDWKYFAEWKRPRIWDKNKVGIEWDIASISTFDEWRRPMLMDLIRQARRGKRVLIMGSDQGCLGSLKQYRNIPTLTIIPVEQKDVRPFIAQSRCIAGLFEGIITVEAWAMGKATLTYNLKGKVIKKYSKPPLTAIFHDVRQVVDRFEDLFNEVWADIIIPHYQSPLADKLLRECVASIPIRNYNVIVAAFGGSFAQNCNRGARRAKTKTLIFLNNDMIVNPITLWQMLDNSADICGAKTIYPDGRDQYYGLGLRWVGAKKRVEYFLTAKPGEATIASGGLFRISKKLFFSGGQPHYRGLDEKYLTGGEDQDLFLNAMSKGATCGFTEMPVRHHLSMSENRFKHVAKNEDRYRRQWLDNMARIKKVFHVIKGCENHTYNLCPKQIRKRGELN
jgi:hypothetical protein